MWAKLGWSVALLVIACSCMPCGRIVTYKISDRFSPEERDTIIQAAEFWNDVSNENTNVGDVLIYDGISPDEDGFTTRDLEDDISVVHKVSHESGIWKKLRRAGKFGDSTLMGYSFVGDIAIATDVLSARFPLELIAKHEFGHMIGVDHIPWKGNLMSSTPSKEFTQLDLAGFCTVFDCIEK